MVYSVCLQTTCMQALQMPVFFPGGQKKGAALPPALHTDTQAPCSHLHSFRLFFRLEMKHILHTQSVHKWSRLPLPPTTLSFRRSGNVLRNQEERRASLRQSCSDISSHEIYRGRFPTGVALRSSCSQSSCRDLQLMLRFPSLQASGADSLLHAAAGCRYRVRTHWHLTLSEANAVVKWEHVWTCFSV